MKDNAKILAAILIRPICTSMNLCQHCKEYFDIDRCLYEAYDANSRNVTLSDEVEYAKRLLKKYNRLFNSVPFSDMISEEEILEFLDSEIKSSSPETGTNGETQR